MMITYNPEHCKGCEAQCGFCSDSFSDGKGFMRYAQRNVMDAMVAIIPDHEHRIPKYGHWAEGVGTVNA